MALPTPSYEPQLTADSQDFEDVDIVQVLASYKIEGQSGRKDGTNGRDQIWEANWDRYWGRYDHSKKADWQSKHVMPETPQFVDRWAAAMREALDAGGEWFTLEDPAGSRSDDIIPVLNKVMSAILSRCAHTLVGHRVDFSSVFEDQMKLGAIMASSVSVTWKDDDDGGWVDVASVDPREVWYDAKGRNLYRIRQYEIDKHELLALAEKEDTLGFKLYNIEAIKALQAAEDEQLRADKEASSGQTRASGGATGRKPIKIDEYLATIVMPNGEIAASRSLAVVANDNYLIRGPEENPFWHKKDWIVFTPMVSVPMSVYGRSYMEDWSDVADAFVEMTNLILDSAFTSAIKAFAMKVSMLEDSTQADEGIHPNIVFKLQDGPGKAADFLETIDLGSLSSDAVTVWNALKQEMREGAKLSEIALGQAAPHARTTAFEVDSVKQAGSAMIRSMARTIETRFLEPTLTLVWMTALQHMDFMSIASEIGQEVASMLQARRQEFADWKLKFRVRGISGLIDRQSKLRNLLAFLQIIGQSEILMQEFMKQASMQSVLNQILTLLGLDPTSFQPSQREQLVRAVAGAGQPPAQPGAPMPAPAPAPAPMQAVA